MLKSSDTAGDKWGVFSLVALGVFMSTLDGSIVNIALPAIMKDLNVPMTTIEWVPLIYLLTISSLLLTFGRLSDIKGRRWVYCLGFVVFSIGSLLCGTARSANWLIAARSFQGIGAAMLMACAPALVVDIFPVNERGRALGMVGTIVAAGLTTGPPLGGFIVKLLSWRFIFYINIPIGIFSALWAHRVLKGGKGDISRAESFDWPGALLLTICFCTFISAITRIHENGDNAAGSMVLLGISVLSAIWLFRVEMRKRHPMFDPLLLRIRLFILPVISAVILFAGLFSMIFLMPFYLVHPAGYSMDKAGLTMVIPFIFLFFVSPVSGWISDHIGSRMLCTFGMIVMTAGLISLSWLSPSAPYPDIAWRLSLVGVGIALFIPPNSAAAMSAVSAQRRGIGGSIVATARNLGMVIGVALAGLTFNSIFHAKTGGLSFKIYRPELEPYFMTAFQYAMRAGGVVTGIGAVVSFLRGPDQNRT